MAVTCGVLILASREFKRGNAARMNKFLWWRVYAQGLTFAAILLGGVYWESARAARVEEQARRDGFDVEGERKRFGWTEDGKERLNGRRAPSLFDPIYHVSPEFGSQRGSC